MKATLKIQGMHCNSCAKVIEDLLEDESVKAKVDFDSGKAEVSYNEEKINISRIISLIEEKGYKVSQE